MDPVGAGASDYRTSTFNQLLSSQQKWNKFILRGNSGEIGVLAGNSESKVRGVDSVMGSSDPLKLISTFARSKGYLFCNNRLKGYLFCNNRLIFSRYCSCDDREIGLHIRWESNSSFG